MTQAYLDDLALQNDFVSAERISAKTGDNINDAFGKIVREVLMRVYTKKGGDPRTNPKDSELKKSIMDYQGGEQGKSSSSSYKTITY